MPATPTNQPLSQISTHLPCRACGYDLYRIGRHCHCPECGFAVLESIEDVAGEADASPTSLKVFGVIAVSIASINVVHTLIEPAHVSGYVLFWLVMVPISFMTAILSVAERQLVWAVFWIGMTGLAVVAVALNLNIVGYMR